MTPVTHPLQDNPLQSRADWQQAVRDLFAPLQQWFRSGYACVRLGYTGAHFSQSQRASELEGFARPLWGLVPLIAGGGDFDDLPFYQKGLAHGSDSHHPEYWGRATDFDQLLVEMAPIGMALAMAPQAFWEPLSQTAKQNLVKWLKQINQVEVIDNNWLFDFTWGMVGIRMVCQCNEITISRLLSIFTDSFMPD
jgi:hypothetical protein